LIKQTVASPALAVPFRSKDDPWSLNDQPQQYPLSVPRSVDIRPGYKNRFLLQDFRKLLPETWRVSFDAAVKSASTIQAHDQVKMHESITRQDLLRQQIFAMEQGQIPDPKVFDIPEFGRIGNERFQYADGRPETAGMVLLLNYPPAHAVNHAMTVTKDTARHMSAGGLSSPTETGNFQLAWSNTLPLFFTVSEAGSLQASGEDAENKRYPGAIVTFCVKQEAQNIMDRAAAGHSQWVFALGRNPERTVGEIIKKVTV
jgi:hypothetical protein